jgi:hypothetical protein
LPWFADWMCYCVLISFHIFGSLVDLIYKLQNMFKNTFQFGFMSILYLRYVGCWSYISFYHYAATLDNQGHMFLLLWFFQDQATADMGQGWHINVYAWSLYSSVLLCSKHLSLCPWCFLCYTSTVSLGMELICRFPWHYHPFSMIVFHSPLFA